MRDPVEIRWIRFGIAGGLCASVLYPAVLFAPLPLVAVAAAAALLGPAIGIGSIGLRQLIQIPTSSVTASLGAVSNAVAGALFVVMAMVQLAVRQGSAEFDPQMIGVWLGIDVAWDTYIGLGTLLFAWSMLRHPRFGLPFAVPGLVVGVALLVLNFGTFPAPPAEVGLIDVGPFVGLWYLAATIQSWRSLAWARDQLGRSV